MMRKRLFAIFSALLFSMLLTVPVSASGSLPRLVDDAGLLSDSEEVDLLEELDEISERQQVDVVVVTVNSLEGSSAMEYADDFLIIMDMVLEPTGMESFFLSAWKKGIGSYRQQVME